MGGVIFKWGGRFFLKEFVYKKQTKQKTHNKKKRKKGKKEKSNKKGKDSVLYFTHYQYSGFKVSFSWTSMSVHT